MSGKAKDKKDLIFAKCEVCSYKTTVTRHRIRPGRLGGLYVAWNVVGLCPNCHGEAEKRILSPYLLQKIILERIKRERIKKLLSNRN